MSLFSSDRAQMSIVNVALLERTGFWLFFTAVIYIFLTNDND